MGARRAGDLAVRSTMIPLRTLSALALTLLILATDANAQKIRSVFGGIADNGGLGYTSPTFQLGAQVEQRWEHLELGVRFDVSSSRKLNFNEGWSATTGTGLVWFFSRPVFVTGGVRFSYTRTPTYDKWALRPYIGAGADIPVGTGELRFSGVYVHMGTDSSNNLHGLDFSARYRSTKGLWYVTAYAGAWTFFSGGYEYDRTNYGLNIGKEF